MNANPISLVFYAAALLTAVSFGAMEARASDSYSSLEDYSFALDALNYQRKRRIITEASGVLINGKRTAFPPAHTTNDETLRLTFRQGYSHVYGPKFGATTMLTARSSLRKTHTQQTPRRITEELYSEINPSLDFHFVTHGGLDFVFGVKAWFHTASTRRSEDSTILSTRTQAATQMVAPRVAFIKPVGQNGFGVFYQESASASRSQRTKVEGIGDGLEDVEFTVDATQEVFFPNTLGLIARGAAGTGQYEAEFSAIHAAGHGAKKADGGRPGEDYQRIRLGYLRALTPAIHSRTMLVHNTLAYARSEDIELNNIPVTALHLRVSQGTGDNTIFASLILGVSRDMASIEELNERFEMLAVGGSLGLNFHF